MNRTSGSKQASEDYLTLGMTSLIQNELRQTGPFYILVLVMKEVKKIFFTFIFSFDSHVCIVHE